MTPAALVLLAAALAAPPDPLPDGKTIDSFTFAVGGGVFRPTGALTVTADGKIKYYDQPGIWTTSSGGPVHKAEWEITKDEAAKLFTGLIADGLLDLPSTVRSTDTTRFTVAHGRWRLYLRADPVPEKLMARLQPLLEKADPNMWKKGKPVAAEKPAVTMFEFTFTTDKGHEVVFGLWRNGNVVYTRRPPASTPGGASPVASDFTPIDSAEAAKLLDALAAAGALDIADATGAAIPKYHVQVFAGRWTIEARPVELPDAVMKHLRPMLEKADPTVWKK